ncbi:uncharacterized protein LOC116921303 [Daphnia magna]|uniref:uncharacterized protein LOC116921303 n=1 Tax=Daphnia magna TaxID=35525 RepID=UPI001E1BDE2A|nr:uncharacterized protein LOC116921303 [Daphnia magna]
MAFQRHIVSTLVVIFLLTQWNDSLHTNATTTNESPSIEIGDQQTSDQYYRPYNGANRRPAYPTYNYGNNQRPSYPAYNQRPAVYNPRPSYTTRRPSYQAATTRRPNYPASNNNYRPATTPSDRFTSGLCISSPNTYQQYGICWDAVAQRMQIGSHLSIENFVRFYIGNLENASFDYQDTSKYYDAICDQSKRFNGVGILCTYDDEDSCNDYRIGGGQNNIIAVSSMCWNEHCICIVGDRYEELALALRPTLSQPAYVVSSFPGGYTGPITSQAIQQHVQQELAAAGIHWQPPQFI